MPGIISGTKPGSSQQPVYLCPVCNQKMIAIQGCHLICPVGHYQEVCSDLFTPDRLEYGLSDPVPSPAEQARRGEAVTASLAAKDEEISKNIEEP